MHFNTFESMPFSFDKNTHANRIKTQTTLILNPLDVILNDTSTFDSLIINNIIFIKNEWM